MTSGSLRLRLILIYALAVSIALSLAGLGVYWRFQRHVETLMLREFDAHFEQLASALTFDGDGKLQVEGSLSDPRFEKQFGGMYWQIDVPDTESLRSRSLWDQVLTIPTPPSSEEQEHVHELIGPEGVALLSLERMIEVEKPAGETIRAVVTIAIDRSGVSTALSGFTSDMRLGMALLYLTLLGSSFFLIVIGLKPLQTIRNALAKIHAGQSDRLDGDFPAEVSPLVNELNTLLSEREMQVARARHRAGNLAHGLKTPLTVLSAIAVELENGGKATSAGEIRDVTRDMNQFVERELMRARMAANQKFASTLVLPVVTRTIAALNKSVELHKDNIQVDILADATAPMDEGDLQELLGNLLENAMKYAVESVHVSYADGTLTVADDGPGVPDDLLDTITKRGVRLDQHKRGSGLGLAIVQDLVDAYGASLSFGRAALGGLSAEVRFSRTTAGPTQT